MANWTDSPHFSGGGGGGGGQGELQPQTWGAAIDLSGYLSDGWEGSASCTRSEDFIVIKFAAEREVGAGVWSSSPIIRGVPVEFMPSLPNGFFAHFGLFDNASGKIDGSCLLNFVEAGGTVEVIAFAKGQTSEETGLVGDLIFPRYKVS